VLLHFRLQVAPPTQATCTNFAIVNRNACVEYQSSMSNVTTARVKGKELSPTERAAIYEARKSGISLRELARQYDCSPRTIALTVQRFEAHGNSESYARTGRPKKLNASQQRYLVLMIKRNPKMTWADIFSNCPVPVAKNTLRQVLGKEWQRKLCSIKENSSG
jgi:transposase